MIAVASPAGLHDVTLGDLGGQAGRRSAAHGVDNDTGNFRHNGIADGLLFQRKARAAGRSHGFQSGNGSSAHGAHGSEFVFHLYEFTANPGE